MFIEDPAEHDRDQSTILISPLIGRVIAGIWIADQVEVVVVNVDHFHRFFIHQRVWHRPSNPYDLVIVDRALVMRVMQLGRANQRSSGLEL